MKNHLILSTLTIALLSACGGGNGTFYSPTASTTQPTINNSDNFLPPGDINGPTTNWQSDRDIALTIKARNDAELKGSSITVPTGDLGILSIPVTRSISDQSNLTVTLPIGQIRLPAFPADDHQNGVFIFNNIDGRDGHSYKAFRVSDNSYRYAQFGNLDFGSQRFAFARGNETKRMPTKGSATYSGDTILNFHNTANQYLRTETGSMTAQADFATRTFNLSVSTPTHNGGVNNARINGSNFSGARGMTSIAGGFAGPEANEVFGSYAHINQDESIVWGSFGGKKQ